MHRFADQKLKHKGSISQWNKNAHQISLKDKHKKIDFFWIGQFLHMYVTASRVRSFDGLSFYISEYNGQGHLANDERVFTKNTVYREVLNL